MTIPDIPAITLQPRPLGRRRFAAALVGLAAVALTLGACAGESNTSSARKRSMRPAQRPGKRGGSGHDN